MLGDRPDLEGDLFFPGESLGCWDLLWACLNSGGPPNRQPPLLNWSYIFLSWCHSVILLHMLWPAIFLWLFFQEVFHRGWVSVIYLQGAGKENSLSLVSEGGISLLSPLLLLKAIPTGWLSSLGSLLGCQLPNVDNDQKLGTGPSPNFTSF